MIAWSRLLVGFVVLICAEVFSGASVATGLWLPWTWLITYWLYLAHFFLFTTLAVRTGRTSLRSLYLWGVLYGLYESWITKVIWSGYSGDGKCVLGKVGPFGFSELSMVFLFHPVLAFIVPLAVACLFFPSLRRWFPDLAWVTGPSRGARLARWYVVISCGFTLGVNSGGPVHLVLNLLFMAGVLAWLLWRTRDYRAAAEGYPVVVLGRKGLFATVAYLAVLYDAAYFFLRPEALPSAWVQVVTLAFYALPIAGLWVEPSKEPAAAMPAVVESVEWRRVLIPFGVLLGLGLCLSFPFLKTAVFIGVVASFVAWTPLGWILFVWALAQAWAQRRAQSRPALTPG